MEVKLCRINGFCSGVRAALELTGEMLAKHGPPVFILHELVHNESVVKDLLARGARIVDDPSFSARTASPNPSKPAPGRSR